MPYMGNINSLVTGPIGNTGNYDEDSIIYLTRSFTGEVFPIDLSWYMAVNGMIESIGRFQWAAITTIWMGFDKLCDAIYGNVGVRMRSRGDIAFQSSPAADSTPELYNKMGGEGEIYSKHPVAGGSFEKRYVDQDKFDKRVDEISEIEWQRLSHATAVGGVYVYGGA